MPTELENILKKARKDKDVIAVILFGSHARGTATRGSDIDICLVLEKTSKDLEKRIEYMISDNLDVHVFQSLPIYVRIRVLGEGKVLVSKDDDFLYALAIRTIQEYEDFRKYHMQYLEALYG